MSVLSQIAPREPDGLMSIDIQTSTRAMPPSLVPIDGPSGALTGDDGLIVDAERVTRILLTGLGGDDRAVDALDAGLDAYVDVWTPTLRTTSRFELISLMVDLDDAVGDVAVVFTESVATSRTAMIGWHVSARFLRPAFLDDDHLIEPTGAVIRLAGATSISFSAARRAERIRCYYDRLALVEQIVGT